MRRLMAYSTSDPNATLAPIRQAGIQQINAAYAPMPSQIMQQMARRGYGSSGAAGDAMYRTGLARAGSIAGLEGGLANSAIQQGQYGAGLGMSLLSAGKGTTSTQASDAFSQNWNKGTGTGTSTSPNMGPSNGLLSTGNALSNLSSLLMLQKVLGGGGGGSSAPGSWGGGTGWATDPNAFGG